MAIIKEISKHVCALGQKSTAETINNFGQKILHTGHVIGRKVSNPLHKNEDVADAVLSIASKKCNNGRISRTKCSGICWKFYRKIHPRKMLILLEICFINNIVFHFLCIRHYG